MIAYYYDGSLGIRIQRNQAEKWRKTLGKKRNGKANQIRVKELCDLSRRKVGEAGD